jgi:hypothetical protein
MVPGMSVEAPGSSAATEPAALVARLPAGQDAALARLTFERPTW